MATGAAAADAAQGTTSPPTSAHEDRGPGSVAGNLTQDPSLAYTNNGRPVCNVRIASAERVKDDNTGQWKDGPTSFYDIQAWGNLAENIAEHLQRGDRIVAEGRWTQTTYEDKNGDQAQRVYLTARDLGPSMMFRGARPVRKEGKQ